MERFVRFVVHQRVPGEPRQVGPFTAAYHLREEGGLPRSDRERLERLLRWFEAELPIPPRDAIPARAVFWYADVGPFSARMWELEQFLNEHGFTAELVTARSVGRVVYRDAHQLAAFRPRRRRR
jgi:hypothetical protein